MTIYYFVKQRFPRRERRAEIRRIFDENGRIPDEVLHDDDYFEPFQLRLSEVQPGVRNRFHRLNYHTLGEYRMQFDLRTIRNMIVKQVRPSNDTSSIYEMFNRLNTGGVNLTPQEIRSSLFHSTFYDCLFKWNMDPRWRKLLGREEPDLHMRDIEVLLRGLAMWQLSHDYAPSMVKFLNRYSRVAQKYKEPERAEVFAMLDWFLSQVEDIDRDMWLRGAKFAVPLFESVFAAACLLHEEGKRTTLTEASLRQLRDDGEFQRYSSVRTTDTENVKGRIRAAKALLS